MALFNSKKITRNLGRLAKDLPKQIANEGQKFYLKSFNSESWEGRRWQPRTARRGIKKRDITRKLLVNKGHLRRAVSAMKREATFRRIRFEVYVQSKSGYNYAQVHNEGIGKQRKRKFLGFNRKLDRIIRRKIDKEVTRAFR